MTRMKFMLPLMAAIAFSGMAEAKTLVFCSEGSPEGFDPALYTSRTTFDVTSRALRSARRIRPRNDDNSRPCGKLGHFQ